MGLQIEQQNARNGEKWSLGRYVHRIKALDAKFSL
jgi:hypothetical protein